MLQHHILTAVFLSFFSLYQHVAVAAPSALALKAVITLLAQNALDGEFQFLDDIKLHLFTIFTS